MWLKLALQVRYSRTLSTCMGLLRKYMEESELPDLNLPPGYHPYPREKHMRSD